MRVHDSQTYRKMDVTRERIKIRLIRKMRLRGHDRFEQEQSRLELLQGCCSFAMTASNRNKRDVGYCMHTRDNWVDATVILEAKCLTFFQIYFTNLGREDIM